MEEKFKLCELKFYKKGDNSIVYYMNVYSSLLENTIRVYINQADFEYLTKMEKNININDFLTRYYNTYKQTFAVKFTRK